MNYGSNIVFAGEEKGVKKHLYYPMILGHNTKVYITQAKAEKMQRYICGVVL